MKKIITIISLLMFSLNVLLAQMPNGQFGDEWIDYNQSYFKIMIAEDGIYRINQSVLSAAGVPVNDINSGNYQLYYLGEEVPIYTSSNQTLGANDYIEFHGQKNRSELDRALFEQPDEMMLNPEYSLFTDTSAYFLTWNENNGLRYNETANNLDNLPAPEAYFMYKNQQIFYQKPNGRSGHIKRKEDQAGAKYSNFNLIEGFSLGFNVSTSLTITPTHVYTNGPSSTLFTQFGTNRPDEGGHNIRITANSEVIFNEVFDNQHLKKVYSTMNTAGLGDAVTVSYEGSGGINDRHAISILSLTHPRTFDFDGSSYFEFEIEASNSRKYLEISNFSTGDQAPVLYDFTNQLRIPTILDNGIVKVVLPSSNSTRKLALFNVTATNTISELENTVFVNYGEQETEYLIISNPRLYDDGNGVNQVQEYANYRSSEDGGSYNVKVVDIQNLYDQYAYGILRHPLSIRNFIQKMNGEWDNLEYVFILGKGREYIAARYYFSTVVSDFFVPTYGYPGSDNLLATNNGQNYPAVPIGRLAAKSGRDIAVYLEKVIGLESTIRNSTQSIEDKSWLKEVIHLGGGNNEREAIRNYLESMGEVITNNKYGANVTSVYKQNADLVQQSQSDVLFDRINEGASILTFFGHGGITGFDFDIDNPSNYNNEGKYPLMISLGCYVGNIHTRYTSPSERFITQYEKKGAIAFMANTALGYTGSLFQLASAYYNIAGGEQYNMSIGKILQKTLESFNNSNSYSTRTMLQQFTLQGDPSLVLSPQEKPDYIIPYSSVNTNPTSINIQDNQFTLNFDAINLGASTNDSMYIQVTQTFPDGSSIIPFNEKVATPKNKKSYTLTIPTYGEESVGLNKLKIQLDANNDIEEGPLPVAESNNTVIDNNGTEGFDLFVTSNGAKIVHPKLYSIANNPNLELIASTLDPLLPSTTFILEIDTLSSFDSPFLQSNQITQTGGLIKWQPNVNWQSEQVYYWRVSPLNPNSPPVWSTSSFVYLPNSGEGWNQSHFQQLDDNNLENLEIHPMTNKLDFGDQVKDVRIKNKVWEPGDSPRYFNENISWGSPVRFQINSGIKVIVREPVTLKYWSNPPGGDYNSINGESGPILPFPYRTNTYQERSDLINMLNEVIPSGYYVTIYSVQRTYDSDYSPELWASDVDSLGTDLFSILEAQGAERVRELESKGSVPYVFMYQKDVGALKEGIADTITDIIDINHGFIGNSYEGAVYSKLIGPAKSWTDFIWENDTTLISENDTTAIHLYGVNPITSTDSLLYTFNNQWYGNQSLLDLSTDLFPYIRLEYEAEDQIDQTCLHLNKWRIHYQGFPDITPNVQAHFEMDRDTLEQGEIFKLSFNVENISNYDMDSVLIKYTITDTENNSYIFNQKEQPINAWENVNTNFHTNTRSLSGGIQDVQVEINANQDQEEYDYTNNYLKTKFFIETDKINPIVDVTFDGAHIMNGDIISPQPTIVVSLKDENPHLSLSDTSNIRLFIEYPNKTLNDISYNDNNLLFTPATAPLEKAKLVYTPTFLEDGDYRLIVQSQDASGNAAAIRDYKVSFKIVTKKAISNVLNYPNPFSSKTKFVYTLTGNTSPSEYAIQIYTVSGKLVKEITQDEMGPLKIGKHQTDYYWDGTDDFGDKLANGVYLYRFVMKEDEAKDYEKINTRTSKFFNRGFSKMVILR